MDETIYDHRSQYPVTIDLTSSSQQRASQPLVIPLEISSSTNTKKRVAAVVENVNIVDDTDTKRMCGDGEPKKKHVEEQKTSIVEKVPEQQQPIKSNGSSSSSGGGGGGSSNKQFGKSHTLSRIVMNSANPYI
jgi:hypothetical protein